MVHAAVNGDLCTMLRRRWQLEQLPLTTIAPAAPRDCTLAADNHPVWDALAGNAIGNIPPASVVVSTVCGDPDTSVTREEEADQSRPPLLHSRPCRAHAGADVHAEQHSTTHSNPCCPSALIVLPVATAGCVQALLVQLPTMAIVNRRIEGGVA
jgi:hypothetical protein